MDEGLPKLWTHWKSDRKRLINNGNHTMAMLLIAGFYLHNVANNTKQNNLSKM